MKVFNLTDRDIDYKGKTLKPYGSENYPDLTFIPDRDLGLQKAGMLSFGSLPRGWMKPVPVQESVPPPPQKVEVKVAGPKGEMKTVGTFTEVKLQETVAMDAKMVEGREKEYVEGKKKQK